MAPRQRTVGSAWAVIRVFEGNATGGAGRPPYPQAPVWNGDTHTTLLLRAAAYFGTELAVVDGELTLTYNQLVDRARGRAAEWLEHGLYPGERIVLCFPNSAEFIEAAFAAWWCGAVPVLVPPTLPLEQLAQVLERAEARFIASPPARLGVDYPQLVAAAARAARHEVLAVTVDSGPEGARSLRGRPAVGAAPVDPHALALIQVDQSETGEPRLIGHTHDEFLYAVRQAAKVTQLRFGDRLLATLPIYAGVGLSVPGVLGAIAVGAATIIAPDPTPATGYELIHRWTVTHVALTPALAQGWSQYSTHAEMAPRSLMLAWLVGAPPAERLALDISERLGCDVQTLLVLPEGPTLVSGLGDDVEAIAADSGLPLSELDEVLVVDAQGEMLPPGRLGQLLWRGPACIRGYVAGGPDAAARFTAAGFFRTGLWAVRGAGGRIRLVPQEGPAVDRGGILVSAGGMARALERHPQVRRARVVAVPDEELGERSRALVQLWEPGAGPDLAVSQVPPSAMELKRFLRRNGEPSAMLPDHIEFVTEDPDAAAMGNQSDVKEHA